MDAPETIEVDSTTVRCAGNDAALGHPAVYLSLEGRKQIDCPYCGRRFVLKEAAETPAH
jgi:uncharacterized Zn-finger protein